MSETETKTDEKKVLPQKLFVDIIHMVLSYMEPCIHVTFFKEFIERQTNEYLTEAIGPFLWKYRDNILKGDLEFFITHDFKEQMNAWNSTIPGASGFAERMRIILKETLQKRLNTNPKGAKDMSKLLLSLYCKYINLNRKREVL